MRERATRELSGSSENARSSSRPRIFQCCSAGTSPQPAMSLTEQSPFAFSQARMREIGERYRLKSSPNVSTGSRAKTRLFPARQNRRRQYASAAMAGAARRSSSGRAHRRVEDTRGFGTLGHIGRSGIHKETAIRSICLSVVFHQLLQWHHLFSSWYPITSVENLQFNTFWDGVFHSIAYLFILAVLFRLWRAARVNLDFGSLFRLKTKTNAGSPISRFSQTQAAPSEPSSGLSLRSLNGDGF